MRGSCGPLAVAAAGGAGGRRAAPGLRAAAAVGDRQGQPGAEHDDHDGSGRPSASGAAPAWRRSQEHRHDPGRGGDQAQPAEHPRDAGRAVGGQGRCGLRWPIAIFPPHSSRPATPQISTPHLPQPRIVFTLPDSPGGACGAGSGTPAARLGAGARAQR